MIHNCKSLIWFYFLSAGDGSAAVAQLGAGIQEIIQWLTENILKLIDKKNDFIVVGSKYSLTGCDSQVPSVLVARNIG